jgi:hypothetical protein
MKPPPVRADITGVNMSVPVLISESKHLDRLKSRPEYAEALSFLDTDTPRALEAILRQKPEIVVVERTFAGKTRGVALINRIKADPTLAECDLRIVGADGTVTRVTSRRVPKKAASTATVTVPTSPVAPQDQKRPRRAPRYPIIDGIEVTVDGNPALLVDLSIAGAQVLSDVLLKPNQRVRLSFMDGTRPVRFSAGVAWSAFELPKGQARYRAGIEFDEADSEALTRFCEINRRDPEKA